MLNLEGDHPLGSAGFRLLQETLLSQEVIKVAADVLPLHGVLATAQAGQLLFQRAEPLGFFLGTQIEDPRVSGGQV